MNVILVPALLFLVGLSIYKKVIVPRRSGETATKPAKASKAPKAAKAEKAPRLSRASKSRPTVNSGRMGSVL